MPSHNTPNPPPPAVLLVMRLVHERLAGRPLHLGPDGRDGGSGNGLSGLGPGGLALEDSAAGSEALGEVDLEMSALMGGHQYGQVQKTYAPAHDHLR